MHGTTVKIYCFVFHYVWYRIKNCCMRSNTGRSPFIHLILCNLALTQLENLHHFSNLQDNFWFNAIWHTQSVATTLIFCMRPMESDVNVMPSVMCMDWSCLSYNHAAYVVSSSTALVFFTIMSEKLKSTSPSAIQVKNRQSTSSIEEKLDVISWFGKDEKIVDICCNSWDLLGRAS